MTDTCPNCGWPLDETLSRLDIAPVEPSVLEGNTISGRVVAFTVTRSGPTDKPCSVHGKWTGTVDLDDFVGFTKTEGTLSWDAGEGGEKRIAAVIDPDNDVEPDEKMTVTMFNPVNCTLGVAEATVTIVNDDVEETEPDRPPTTTPTKGYNEDLPFGGLGIGTPCLLGQP